MYRYKLFDITEKGDHHIGESHDLNHLSEDLEYGDVAQGDYLVLDSQTGIKYTLAPDRKVAKNDYYSVPSVSGRVVWRPILEEESID